MKEKLKYFLLGVCSVVGGFLLYAWTRNTSEPSRVAREGRAVSVPDPATPSSATGAYVAHRKEQIQKQKAARACDAVRPDIVDTSLSDVGTSTPAASDHALQNTGAGENSQ